MRYRNTAYRTSFCELMAALGAAFMLTGNLIPVLTYVSPMLAGMTLIPVLYEFGKKSAWMTWAVTAALAMMLCADREEAFFYLFTGFYPIIKPDLDRIRSKSLRFLAKLAVFTVSIACMVLILLFVVGMTDIRAQELCERFGVSDDADLRYMFAKSVFSCITTLFSPGCSLGEEGKLLYIREISSNPRVQKRCRDTSGGLPANTLCRILRKGHPRTILNTFRAVALVGDRAPDLFMKLKHRK